MPYVEAFSSHKFDKAFLVSPTVGQLAQEVEQRQGKPFVLTAQPEGRAIWVLPGRFEYLRANAALDDDDSVRETGLLDALGAGQLNVDAEARAAAVARLLEAIGGALAIVQRAGDPVGVFVPSAVLKVLPYASVLADRPSGDQVAALARAGDLVEALRLAETSFSDFHSEGINQVHPRPLVCGYGGGHVVGRCPCRDHRDSPCARS